MVRDVDLTLYLPEFMKEYEEPKAVMSAENPEFTAVWTAADKVFNNHFVLTADEDGISRYEEMIGILPDAGDSLEYRRQKVLAAWNNKLPYSYRVMVEALELAAGDAGVDVDVTDYLITVYLYDIGAMSSVRFWLDNCAPLNMYYEIHGVTKEETTCYIGSAFVDDEVFELRERVNV